MGFNMRISAWVISIVMMLCMGTTAVAQENIADRKIFFELADNHGRQISSVDYKGIPLFFEFGACW